LGGLGVNLIEQFCVDAGGMDGGHGRLQNCTGFLIFEQRLDHVCEPCCGAGCGGNQQMFLRVKGGVVDPVVERVR